MNFLYFVCAFSVLNFLSVSLAFRSDELLDDSEEYEILLEDRAQTQPGASATFMHTDQSEFDADPTASVVEDELEYDDEYATAPADQKDQQKGVGADASAASSDPASAKEEGHLAGAPKACPPLSTAEFFKWLSRTDHRDFLRDCVEGEATESSSQSEDEEDAASPSRKKRSVLTKPKIQLYANCALEKRSVSLLNSFNYDSSYVYYPTSVLLDQCGGCCNNDLLECQPKRTELENVTIDIFKPNHDPVTNKTQGFVRSRSTQVSVSKHIACACDCKIKPKDCQHYQHYVADECRCVCTNDGASTCQEFEGWSPKHCKCVPRVELGV